jgi:hypothetical protein
MTQDEIIEMARQAKLPNSDLYHGNLEAFADKILEEVAQEIAKLPFGDTAASFAVFVRQMKVNEGHNESGRRSLSASSTPAE